MKHGFTLTEVLLVLVPVGVVALVATSSLSIKIRNTPQYSEDKYEYGRLQDYTYFAIINKHPKSSGKSYWEDYLK